MTNSLKLEFLQKVSDFIFLGKNDSSSNLEMYELGQIGIADESFVNVGADQLHFADVGSAHLKREKKSLIFLVRDLLRPC